ncbi:hypothetical protein [Nocardioides sp.]|uniref:hypothetical protein n=1 Tax=Nocardioides sp. TaxID=35761 RepID=UPI002B26D6A5|nr:hypothetical protein [Nocardioides sp.]
MLLSAGGLTWSALSPDDGSGDFEVTIPAGTAAVADAGAAALALQDLQRAVSEGDVSLAQEVAVDSSGPQSLLAALVTNAELAQITDVQLRYVDEIGAVTPDGRWSAAVAVQWRYDGFDRAPASTETTVAFVSDDEGTHIAGIGGETLRTPVWMSGPLSVSRTSDYLLLVSDTADLARYARLTERAVRVVSEVVVGWDGRLVVEVPRDAHGLERALGVEPGFYQQIAAVTGSADGSVSATAPIHVYVNPEVFDGLGPRGQEVVLDHEAAHVAGEGPLSRAPAWLIEGYADYVALRDSTLPLTKTAAQIRDQVRADGPPMSLPGPAEFDTRGTHLGAVYESAWLACRVLAERGGDAAFLDFYERVSDGEAVGPALQSLFGWSEADLISAWTSRLESLP